MNSINPYILEIFKTNSIRISDEKSIPLTSNIDKNEGEFIWDILTENKFNSTIEIGCAEGISSLFICDAIHSHSGHHTIIDPYQEEQWDNVGIETLKKFGYSNFDLIELPSEYALPQLILENKKYDFGFIDGWHTFDQTILDFYFLNRLINIGGIIVIDDALIPGVKRAVQFFYRLPNFKLIGGINKINNNFKRILLEHGKSFLNIISRPLGYRIREEFFNFNVYNRSASNQLNFSMIAFKKTGDDLRPWNWHKDF